MSEELTTMRRARKQYRQSRKVNGRAQDLSFRQWARSGVFPFAHEISGKLAKIASGAK